MRRCWAAGLDAMRSREASTFLRPWRVRGGWRRRKGEGGKIKRIRAAADGGSAFLLSGRPAFGSMRPLFALFRPFSLGGGIGDPIAALARATAVPTSGRRARTSAAPGPTFRRYPRNRVDPGPSAWPLLLLLGAECNSGRRCGKIDRLRPAHGDCTCRATEGAFLPQVRSTPYNTHHSLPGQAHRRLLTRALCSLPGESLSLARTFAPTGRPHQQKSTNKTATSPAASPSSRDAAGTQARRRAVARPRPHRPPPPPPPTPTMIDLGLARISQLLRYTPQTWKAVHVAGTNGKGSICAYLSAMLQASGARCGRFTSPHLVDRWDCIAVDGRPVSEALFREAEAVVRGRDSADRIGATSFELLTATAFEIFRRAGVDFGVVEVGLGGALDATNAMAHKAVAVISKIGLDPPGLPRRHRRGDRRPQGRHHAPRACRAWSTAPTRRRSSPSSRDTAPRLVPASRIPTGLPRSSTARPPPTASSRTSCRTWPAP